MQDQLASGLHHHLIPHSEIFDLVNESISQVIAEGGEARRNITRLEASTWALIAFVFVEFPRIWYEAPVGLEPTSSAS